MKDTNSYEWGNTPILAYQTFFIYGFGLCVINKKFLSSKTHIFTKTQWQTKHSYQFLVIVLLAVGVYFYAYKDHRNIANEGAAFADTALAIKDSLAQNNEAFFNQTLIVLGVVTAVEDNTLTLNDVLVAQFESSNPIVSINQQLTLKGRCIGYDDLFDVVVLDQSIILE